MNPSRPLATALLQRRGLDDDIAGKLRSEILNGELVPGARLTELELAAYWNVSQGTIRAALKRLQHEGLVESRPRRGTFVTALSESDVIEIYTLRDALEGLAARRASTRVSDDGRRAFERILRSMRDAVSSGNRRKMRELDFQFHRAIIEMSRHSRLIDAYTRLEVQTRLFLNMTDHFHHDLDGLLAMHEPIALAILAGDAESAYSLASHHSERDGERLAETIFENPT